MTVVVTIDPNVRVNGNKTYAAFEDVRGGDAHINDHVRVQVDETDLVGNGVVSSLDWESRLVYLEVDWSSIRPDPTDGILRPEDLPALHPDRRNFPDEDVI
ncbi:hypothetical protein ACX80D_09815 [Arthrobacter sp. Sr24]